MTDRPDTLSEKDIDKMSADELDQALLEEKRDRLRAMRDARDGKVEIGFSPEIMNQQRWIIWLVAALPISALLYFVGVILYLAIVGDPPN